jgi:2-hydroxy-3-oxopropionate reductase
MKTRIGYIGLGIMGKAIARNLLKAGFPLTVHNRSRSAVNELVAEGAHEAHNPREVAENSDIVFTNLPDSPDVELVLLGEDGVLSGSREGMILVDNSTIKPETARSLAAAAEKIGVHSLDAPVSGGDIGAVKGTLAIMVGGNKLAFDRTVPVFEAMGSSITYVGESGAGQVAKACNQIMVTAQMTALGELLVFAEKSGVDPRQVVEAIRGGAAQCWTLDNKPQRLFAGDRNPGFKAYMMYKDLGIVLDSARSFGVSVPATALNFQLYEAMLQQGHAELDNSGVIAVIEQLANIRLTEDPE